MSQPFVFDLAKVRAEANARITDGAVTAAYTADREAVVKVLNDALATELVCVLRYRNHHYMARGIHAHAVAAEFLEHANQEMDHAGLLAVRITQLGGRPSFDPATLTKRSHAEYREGGTLEEMLRENLIAERIAIASYSAIVTWLGADDPTTRRVIETILAVEEEHADDLANLLDQTRAAR
jgi:bacterioferritin